MTDAHPEPKQPASPINAVTLVVASEDDDHAPTEEKAKQALADAGLEVITSGHTWYGP